MAKKIAGQPAHDLTMPTVDVEIDGRQYHLVFTYGAMSLAKVELNRQKLSFNVLVGCDPRNLDVDTLPVMLYAALITGHPELSFAEVKALITMRTYLTLADAVTHALLEAFKDPKLADKGKNERAE